MRRRVAKASAVSATAGPRPLIDLLSEETVGEIVEDVTAAFPGLPIPRQPGHAQLRAIDRLVRQSSHRRDASEHGPARRVDPVLRRRGRSLDGRVHGWGARFPPDTVAVFGPTRTVPTRSTSRAESVTLRIALSCAEGRKGPDAGCRRRGCGLSSRSIGWWGSIGPREPRRLRVAGRPGRGATSPALRRAPSRDDRIHVEGRRDDVALRAFPRRRLARELGAAGTNAAAGLPHGRRLGLG